jgi:hypothetical protein
MNSSDYAALDLTIYHGENDLQTAQNISKCTERLLQDILYGICNDPMVSGYDKSMRKVGF